MHTLKTFLMYTIILSAAFIASGESYIYYLNSASNDCDYYFECKITSPELRESYAQEIIQYSNNTNFFIYAVDYKPVSDNSAKYTIYTPNEDVEQILKEKFKTRNKTHFKSLFSGRIEVQYKPINEIKHITNLHTYNVIGNASNFNIFRSATIDTYGTGKAFDGSYDGDHSLIFLSTWIITYILIFFISIIESTLLRKEVCIKYINGYSLKLIVANEIKKNGIALLIAAFVGFYFANLFTEVFPYRIIICILILIALCISSTLFAFNLRIRHIEKVILNGLQINKFQKIISVCLFTISMALLMLSVTICIQNIDNAWQTIKQENFWKKYANYTSITFFSKEESELANHDLDKKYASTFYKENLELYDISMAFNIADNGGMFEYNSSGDEPIVYMNLNGAKKCNLPIDVSKLSSEKIYIISPYTKKEIKSKILKSDLQHILDSLQNKENHSIPKYKKIKRPYKITLLDIKSKNLSHNNIKNPIIIVDTHDTIPEAFATNICTSILKFNDEKDFARFIENINYTNQVWYEEDVSEIYRNKRNLSFITMTINIFTALFLLLLFYISLFIVLKNEFQHNAKEISILKILGANIFSRYFKIIKIIFFISIVITSILLALNMILSIVDSKFILYVLAIVYLSVYIVFVLYVNAYEKQNIPKVLKGGY